MKFLKCNGLNILVYMTTQSFQKMDHAFYVVCRGDEKSEKSNRQRNESCATYYP